MKAYFFTIFSRAFLALSGFLVFLLTSYLYGPEGRGVIGYATSVFATLGSVLSFNLGRGFLAETVQDEIKKKNLLGKFLTLNLIFGFLASGAGLFYIFYSDAGRSMLTPLQSYLFSMTSLFYIWSANGNYFFSSFFKTSLQDLAIFLIRLLLIVCLGALAYFKDRNFDHFALSYCLILTAGVIIENVVLLRDTNTSLIHRPDIQSMWRIVKKSFAHHVDYLAFNIFPLILTIISASYISKSDVGKVNFAFQIINLIFLFSVTANIKISAFVSHSGYKANLKNYKKLAFFTALISLLGCCSIYVGLKISVAQGWLAQFEGVQQLFLISTLSVPGYILYQFLCPVWIELKRQNLTAILHSCNFLVGLIVANYLIKEYQMIGVMYSYAIFGCGIATIQIILFFKIIVPSWKLR